MEAVGGHPYCVKPPLQIHCTVVISFKTYHVNYTTIFQAVLHFFYIVMRFFGTNLKGVYFSPQVPKSCYWVAPRSAMPLYKDGAEGRRCVA